MLRLLKSFNLNFIKQVSGIEIPELYNSGLTLKFKPYNHPYHYNLSLPSNRAITDPIYPGEVFEKERGIQHACGNINPQTGQSVGSFPRQHAKVVRTCDQWRESKGKIGSDTPTTGAANKDWGTKSSDWGSAVSVKVYYY